jgi:hypothetical protein
MKLRCLLPIVLPGWLVACSLIVTDELPSFHCTGSDPSACPTGLVCNSTTSTCEAPVDGAVVDQDGGDAAIGENEGGPASLGASCENDGDCKAGLLCGTSTILTTTIVPADGRICTKTCCTSQDCATGFICFPAATGGNYCVPAEKAARAVPGEGAHAGGEACSTSEDCRSGLCGDTGQCIDTCCAPSDCASGTVCRVADVNSRKAWACGPPAGTLDVPQQCQSVERCKNDNCVRRAFSSTFNCTPSCCSAADCAAQGLANNVCAYGQSENKDWLKWCFEPNKDGGAAGTKCNGNNAECASRYCDRELGRCANVCCKDQDCAEDEHCQPSPGSTPFLRCVKNR